jgi:hypothetical protein
MSHLCDLHVTLWMGAWAFPSGHEQKVPDVLMKASQILTRQRLAWCLADFRSEETPKPHIRKAISALC